MKYSLGTIIERIQRLSTSMGGVFSYGDLFNVIGSGSEIGNKRKIKRLIKEGILFKVQRGFYVTKEPDLSVLACRLKKTAYISMDSALAAAGLIGTLPVGSISAVAPGIRKRTVETGWGALRFFSLKEDLIFGVCTLPNGVQVADNEKAFLDMLYFYTKGAGFVIDPLSEVNLGKLDRKRLLLYLRRYRNPKFVTFVRGLINENA